MELVESKWSPRQKGMDAFGRLYMYTFTSYLLCCKSRQKGSILLCVCVGGGGRGLGEGREMGERALTHFQRVWGGGGRAKQS